MMLITVASAPALSGSHDSNPLYFDHYNISHLSAEIDGKIYPSNGYSVDFVPHQTPCCYDGLCRVLEVYSSPEKALPFKEGSTKKASVYLALTLRQLGPLVEHSQ